MAFFSQLHAESIHQFDSPTVKHDAQVARRCGLLLRKVEPAMCTLSFVYEDDLFAQLDGRP